MHYDLSMLSPSLIAWIEESLSTAEGRDYFLTELRQFLVIEEPTVADFSYAYSTAVELSNSRIFELIPASKIAEALFSKGETRRDSPEETMALSVVRGLTAALREELTALKKQEDILAAKKLKKRFIGRIRARSKHAHTKQKQRELQKSAPKRDKRA